MTSDTDLQSFLEGRQAAWSRQDVDAVLAFFAEEFAFEDIPIGLHATNKSQMREVLETTFGGVPNFKMEILEHKAGDGFLVTKWIQTGNMTVQGYGLDLTDHAYEVMTTSVTEMSKDSKITSLTDNWNAGVFYQ